MDCEPCCTFLRDRRDLSEFHGQVQHQGLANIDSAFDLPVLLKVDKYGRLYVSKCLLVFMEIGSGRAVSVILKLAKGPFTITRG